jgi:hypothetical protein
MKYGDPLRNTDIFAALKLQTHNILGRVISINKDELIFHSVSDDEIPLGSFQHIDVFTKGQIFFRDLRVKVISNNKIQDERSFSKMTTRMIRVSLNHSETAGLTPNTLRTLTSKHLRGDGDRLG